MLYIVGGKVITMAGECWEKGYICIEDGKISEIGPVGKDGSDFILDKKGVGLIKADGCVIMPGMIDAHCHLGILEQNMGVEGNDCNENMEAVTPWLRAIDGINPLDPSFMDAASAGITSVMVGPGSSNVVGGQFVLMKTKRMIDGREAKKIDDLLVKSPAAMKISFGENVKVNFSELNKSPVTRMAIAGCLREELFKARQYYKKRTQGDKSSGAGKKTEIDFRYECWISVFDKKIPLKAHAHRADDMITAMRIAKEFNLDLTLDHGTESSIILDELVEEKYPVIWGPGFGDKHKIELQNMNFDTLVSLNRAGIKTAICTDHPVTLIQTLPICAAYAVKSGLLQEEALKSITLNAAEICRVDDRIGSLEVGKDADIVIFDGNPLNIMSKVNYTIIDGEIVYQV